MTRPLLVVLAGPNGAGKSTYYHTKLALLRVPFLNADVLAKEKGLTAYEAAAEVANIRDALCRQKRPFILETVLSDPVGDKVHYLKHAVETGFDVRVIYIGIDSAEVSRQRVEQRVAAGGHDVPLDKVMARYDRSLANLERAIHLLPWVNLVDNGSISHPHRLVARFRNRRLALEDGGDIPSWTLRFLQG